MRTIMRLLAFITVFCVIALNTCRGIAAIDESDKDGEISRVTPSVSISKYSQEIPSSTSILSNGVVSKGIPVYEITIRAVISASASYAGAAVVSASTMSGTLVSVGGTVKNVDLNHYNGFSQTKEFVFHTYQVASFSVTVNVYGSTNTSASTNISVAPSAIYTDTFLMTYYITAAESDYSGSYDTAASGISGKLFKASFLNAVKMNGTGYTHYGNYIQYHSDTNTYTDNAQVITATGTTATAGRTIAVDNYHIPRYKYINDPAHQWAKVYIIGIGYRQAEDAGGAITGHHIDVYIGTGIPSPEPSWNMTYKQVLYDGNNMYSV